MSTENLTLPGNKPVLKTAKKEFINYIHNFRGLAIIFIIGGHVVLALKWPPQSSLYILFDTFWENGSVLFVFIAGYLFQHLSKKFEYKSYITKKIQNVLFPYLIVSLIPVVLRVAYNSFTAFTLELHPDIATWSILHKTTYLLLHGAQLPQLWFVPMISIFYLFAPVFIYVDRKPKLYYLIFLLVFVSLMVKREPFSDILKMFVHFLSVYMFGMFMSRYKTQYLEFAKRYWILISTLTIAAFTLNFIYYYKFNGPLNYIHKMLFCGFFIYWLWRLDKYIPKVMAYLAEISFGIFFIHYYFIVAYYYFSEKVYRPVIQGNMLNFILCFGFTLVGSMLLIKLVKKISPRYSRTIIGC